MHAKHASQYVSIMVLCIAIIPIWFFIPVAKALNINSIEFESSDNQYASIADADQSGLDLTDTLTLEAWVKFETDPAGNDAPFISKRVGSGNQRSYLFYMSGASTLAFEWQDNGLNGTGTYVTWNPTAGTWYHLAVTKSGTSVNFYVNGVQQGTTQTGDFSVIHNGTAPLEIGAFNNAGLDGPQYLDGLMDDVRVWNVERTDVEIAADMNVELVGNETGLVGYWKFNGESLEDATANNNDLTNVNGATFSEDVPFADEPPPSTPDPVILIPGILGSAEKNGAWTIDPILHTYDDLIATLEANGYTLGHDLFTFGYDWRSSNVTTAELLKEKIDEVKVVCNCEKVDLVAHSMGGLVARQYVQSAEYENDVDQLIFLGTPHRGAPKAYLMWEGGVFVSPSVTDGLTTRFLKGEARKEGYASIFEYIHAHPISAVEQLLPDYDYLFDEAILRTYPNEYPQNTFLESLNAGVSGLLSSGISLHSFVGSVGSTITGISVVDAPDMTPLWSHGYPDGFDSTDDRGLVLGAGDQTVPLGSATYLGDVTAMASSHNALPEDAAPDIVELLRGEPASEVVDNWNVPNVKILLFQLFSPADLLITDPNGKSIGMSSGVETNEIPGAFYAGPNANSEYITIPNPVDGTYTVDVQGTGEGSYEVVASYLAEGVADDVSRFGTTTIEKQTTHLFELAAQEADELRVSVGVEGMREDLSFVYGMGWISKGAWESLKAKLNAAAAARGQNSEGMMMLVKNIRKEIEKRHGSSINDEAYMVLIEDIQALQ